MQKLCRWTIFATLALLFGFSILTVYSSDDYWYSTFLDKGLGHYWELMKLHYETFNGRVWVHIVAHVVLWAGKWLFAVLCCGCCVMIPWVCGRAVGMKKETQLAVMGLFLVGIVAMPVHLFTEGMMWISAFCNYMLPTTVLCLLVCLLERDGSWAAVLAVAFLCGASTEQTAIAALILLALYLLSKPESRRKISAAMLTAGGGG